MPKNGYAKAATKVAAGLLLIMAKNQYSTGAAIGMIGNGILHALQEANVIKTTDVAISSIGEQRTWIAGVDSPSYQSQPVAVFQ